MTTQAHNAIRELATYAGSKLGSFADRYALQRDIATLIAKHNPRAIASPTGRGGSTPFESFSEYSITLYVYRQEIEREFGVVDEGTIKAAVERVASQHLGTDDIEETNWTEPDEADGCVEAVYSARI